MNLDELKTSQVRDHRAGFKDAAAPSTSNTIKTDNTGGGLFELDLLGEGGDSKPTMHVSTSQTGGAISTDIDFLALESDSHQPPQNKPTSSNNMMDLLGDDDILSPKPMAQQNPSLHGGSPMQPHDPLGGFDLSGTTSPQKSTAQTPHSTMGGDGLDLLGGINSSPHAFSNTQTPSQTAAENDLFGMDLLGGSSSATTSPQITQKALNFVGYEDNSLIVKFSCVKVDSRDMRHRPTLSRST